MDIHFYYDKFSDTYKLKYYSINFYHKLNHNKQIIHLHFKNNSYSSDIKSLLHNNLTHKYCTDIFGDIYPNISYYFHRFYIKLWLDVISNKYNLSDDISKYLQYFCHT